MLNLERQVAIYQDTEGVLLVQQAALVARDTDRLDAANRRQMRLADALAMAETERRQLAGPSSLLSDVVSAATGTSLQPRAESAASLLPVLVRRVSGLARTNRVLAADAKANCDHLLRLLGLAEPPAYGPAPLPAASRGSLCLDVTA